MKPDLIISDHAALLLRYPQGPLLACTEDNHYKFWHCLQQGKVVQVNWGRIGSWPREQVKEFLYDWQAEDFVRSKIREKEGKGYSSIR